MCMHMWVLSVFNSAQYTYAHIKSLVWTPPRLPTHTHPQAHLDASMVHAVVLVVRLKSTQAVKRIEDEVVME